MAEHERPVVAFLGPEASYTHQAALDAFNKDEVKLSPQITIADVFTAVQNGTAYRGVVPFENSSNGSVVFTLDLISDPQNKHPDILVCGEAYVAVKHCLLGHAPTPVTQADRIAGKPLADLSKITKLYSHPQAWGQCTNFLTTHLKATERHDVSSTSRAAEIAAADRSGESAALSSAVAASLFGLDILAESINDHVGNTTRFLVIKNKNLPIPSPLVGTEDADSKDANFKTLITFTVDHANPGALAHCLAAFEKFGLNLTSINTRPSGVRNWHYVFFVELRGRREEGGAGEVNKALGELDGVARGGAWKGSWESAGGIEE
ncbi:hypothetical protein HBI91_022270 [Parastagonospora nodorum]|nr:hypothetical protein HBI91_022270 [Parastagonospora nodorum]